MKTYFICNLLLLLQMIQGTIHDKFQDDVTLYTDIGSDVILKCNVANTTRSIWRRENKIISDGLNINPELQHRLKIIGDKALGEYNLHISDLTERDVASYWCERHVYDVVNEKQVVIKLTEHQTTNSKVDISTEITTTTVDKKRTTKQSKIMHTINSTTELTDMITDPNAEEGSTISISEKEDLSTEFKSTQSMDVNNKEKKMIQTGFSLNDKFLHYGILAVGFVLLLISSILCNVCISHKCKKAGLKISQNDERVVPTGPPHEIEDVFSQYETIDENNMEPMQMVEKVEGTANPRTSSVNSNSSSDRSYLEVIDIDDDYLNPYQPIETNNQSDILHKYCTLNMVSSPECEATTQPEAKMECDKDFIGEIIVKQIESNLILKIFESSNSFDSEISLTENNDKSKEREESSNMYCPLKKSEIMEENRCSLQKKPPAEYINLNW